MLGGFLIRRHIQPKATAGFDYMPERDDTVLVYFPDKNEDAAMAISSVRKDVNPNEKNKIRILTLSTSDQGGEGTYV